MTANEWRFKMCVLARDEWRKNNDAYTGLCGLFCRIIRREGFVETDDQKLNAKMLVFMNYEHRYHGVTVTDLIPKFVRPADCDSETLFWWDYHEKDVRLNFLQDLVTYYANLIDHEEDEK